MSCGKKVEKKLCFFPLLRCVFEQRFIVQEAVFFLCAFTLRCFRSSTAHMEVQARTAAKNTTFGLFFLHASFFFFLFPLSAAVFFFLFSFFLTLCTLKLLNHCILDLPLLSPKKKNTCSPEILVATLSVLFFFFLLILPAHFSPPFFLFVCSFFFFFVLLQKSCLRFCLSSFP